MKNLHIKIALFSFMMLSIIDTQAQVGINTDGSQPDNSAMLDIKSTTRGILIPRMTQAQRDAITNPVNGLLIYQTDDESFYYYNGSAWNSISAGGTDNDWTKAGHFVYNLTDSIGIGVSTPGAILDVHGHIWQTGTGGAVFVGEGAGKNDDLRSRRNVFVGLKAGNANISGENKIAIGNNALALDSINNNLIAIGDSVLYNNKTVTHNGVNINGYNNIGLGSNSLFSKQTGNNNLAVGNYAAYKDKYASQNIAIGDSALYKNGLNDYLGQTNHANNNIAIGVASGKNNEYNNGTIIIGNKAAYNNNSIGLQAIAIGHNAMEYTGGGRSYSVAIGNNAMRGMKDSVPSGSHYPNMAIGYAALYKNFDGSANTAVGYISQKQNFNNYYNTSLGYESLGSGALDDLSVGIGNFNTAIGVKAMMMNNGGNHNIAMGYKSLMGNRIGNENVGIGTNVLQFNTRFSGSTAIGYQAMSYYDNTGNNSYSGNTALGYQALKGYSESTTVIHYGNTAIGSDVLSNIIGGDSNTALGSNALKLNTDGSYNCAVGASALQSNQTGNYNTVMGIFSGNNATGSGNIFIGAFSGFHETGNNRLYIENSSADADNALIYGEFDNNILRVNGQLQIHNISGTGFAFPTADGNSNQIIQTDGNGQLSWIDVPVSANGSIDKHSDVDTSTATPTNGQVLKWDGNNWTPANDSNTTYSAGTGLDLAGMVFSLNSDINNLTDVDTSTTAPATNQILSWNGTNWVPKNDDNTTYTASNGVILSGNDFQHDDTSTQTSVDNSNANVIQDIALDNFGHITAISSVDLDTHYYTQTQLQTSTAAQVHWNNLTNVPASLQDGDDDTTYSAGTGLDLSGTTFSLNSGINGLTDVDTSTNAPTNGQVLAWDGTNWVPKDATDTGAHEINDLTDGKSNGDSVFLGNSAGAVGNSHGSTGVGVYCLNASTGDNNSAFGYGALAAINTGTNNVSIGFIAGLMDDADNPITDLSSSIFIGAMTKPLNTTGDTNEIVIGTNTTGLGSNTVIIGDANITKTALNGKVGIGTTDPKSALQVNGGVQVADDTDTASVDKVGTLRYRADSNNSYIEMCVQTGTTTYAWIVIHQETW